MVYSCKLIAIQECTDRGLGASGAPTKNGMEPHSWGSPEGRRGMQAAPVNAYRLTGTHGVARGIVNVVIVWYRHTDST